MPCGLGEVRPKRLRIITSGAIFLGVLAQGDVLKSPRPDFAMRLVVARLFALAGVLLAGAAVSEAQTREALRIVPLVRDDRVLVSFDLTDGFSDDVRAAIHSGLKTTFTYVVELRLDVPGWVDRSLATSTVTNSVEFDNLTRRYQVVRQVDGRTEESRVTDDEATVRQWMTNLVRLPLFRTALLEPNREYYVRVSATARPTNGSMLWPFGSGTSAQKKFTFIR
jgi:hypothetical protein